MQIGNIWPRLETLFELIPIKQIFGKLTVAVSRIYVMGLYFVRLKITGRYGILSLPVFFFTERKYDFNLNKFEGTSIIGFSAWKLKGNKIIWVGIADSCWFNSKLKSTNILFVYIFAFVGFSLNLNENSFPVCHIYVISSSRWNSGNLAMRAML